MNLLEAVWVRRSQRTYLPRPLEEVQREQLGKALAECSRRSGLHLRLVCPQVSPFAGQGRLKGPGVSPAGRSGGGSGSGGEVRLLGRGAGPHRRGHGAGDLLGGRDL